MVAVDARQRGDVERSIVFTAYSRRCRRQMKQQHAIIIGGGLGGLALSLRLAVKGWKVTVCERSSTPGGKMNLFEKDGFRFDTGPSLITMPEVFEELFSVGGSKLSDHLTLHRIDPLAYYAYADGTRFLHTTSLPHWLKTVRDLDARDVDGFWRFFRLGARLYEVSRSTFLSRSPVEPPQIGQLASLRHMPLRYGWGNYGRTVDKHFHSPHLRQLYNRYPTYVGSSPYRAPATLAVIPYIESALGGWYMKGGLYTLVTAILELLRSRGGEVLTSAEVVRILRSGGRVNGVQLADGTVLTSDIVIMNGDASQIPQLLGETAASQPSQDRRSLSGIVFLLGISKKLPDMHHHNIYFSADYQQEFHQLFDQMQFPEDPTVYVNIPSRTDPNLAPAGGESVFVLANAPAADGTTWDSSKIELAWKRVYARLRSNGFPDIQRDIVVRDVWTPSRIQSTYGMPGGSIYGLASHSWKTAFFRPSNRDPKVQGLYRVGGSSHPGGGTPMVLLSAQITSRLIERDHHA
jgi:diapolycopene oxygenase